MTMRMNLIDEAKQIREKDYRQGTSRYGSILLSGLADLRHKQGKYDEALPMYEEALRIFIKFLGENHPTTQTLRGHLESCRAEMEQ